MMKSNSIFLTLRTMLMIAVIGSLPMLTSCEEVLDEITYEITINNNSSEDLELWLSVDGSAFEKSTDLGAGQTTTSSFYVADTEYEYEARQSDGSVYATRTFNQSDTTDQTWDIN